MKIPQPVKLLLCTHMAIRQVELLRELRLYAKYLLPHQDSNPMNITHTFAQISPTEFGSIITVIGGMLIGFYALVKFILTSHEKTQEKDRLERLALAKAVERMATATENAAKEAEARNGHLAEMTKDAKDATLEAIRCIKLKQQVAEQHVDLQTVEHEEVRQ
jgi:hypothetical protein